MIVLRCSAIEEFNFTLLFVCLFIFASEMKVPFCDLFLFLFLLHFTLLYLI